MSKLSKQIRKYVSCPELGDKYYGKWGILTLEQRQNIAQLCEYCDQQENFADTFFKETQALKHQLADTETQNKRVLEKIELLVKDNQGLQQQLEKKDKEIEEWHNFMKKWHFENFEAFEKHYKYLMSLKNREQLMVENEAMKETIAILLGQKKTTEKTVRHQICEEIREKIDKMGKGQDNLDFLYFYGIDKILDQIEQGESK